MGIFKIYENGKLTHGKDKNGFTEYYDENGNIIKYTTPYGREVKLDKNGKPIYMKTLDNKELFINYDEYGNLESTIDSNGLHSWYNKEGRCIHSEIVY